MGIEQNISIYCKLRNQQFNNYCVQNGFQADAKTKQSFFEMEREKVDGKPNPVFVETMKYVSAFTQPIPNKVNLYCIIRGQGYKSYLSQNGFQDTPESKNSFFSYDLLKQGVPNPEFIKSMSYVDLMSDTSVRKCAETFASIKSKEYEEFLSANKMTDGLYTKAMFFTQNRDAALQPNSDFKQVMEAVVVLRENLTIANRYVQERQEEYVSFVRGNGLENNPESVARFFVKEREKIDGKPNPVFKEVMAKISQEMEDQSSFSTPNANQPFTQKTENTLTNSTPVTTVHETATKPEPVVEGLKENTTNQTVVTNAVVKDEVATHGQQNNSQFVNSGQKENTITPRQDFKNMPIDKLLAYVRFGINDNGPHKVPYLSGGMGSITEEVIPAAMEYLSRNPNLASIELRDLNGINLNITQESTLEGLVSEWTTTMDAKMAEAQARREQSQAKTEETQVIPQEPQVISNKTEEISQGTSVLTEIEPVNIPIETRERFGEKYDLDAIASGPNANEVLNDLPAFDNLAHGQAMVEDQTKFIDPTLTQTISTTNN